MDKNLTSYITKYDKWLSEKTISFSSKVIPVKESFDPARHLIPSLQAENILDSAGLIALARCVCRTKYKNCDRPLEVCFVLNETGEKWIAQGRARQVTIVEARQVLTRANQAGLVHMTLFKPDHELFALCSCCPCCCHDLQLVLKWSRQYITMHADYIARDRSEDCLHCGECAQRCPFTARVFDGETLTYRSDNCYGCGLCVSTCPAKAIEMVTRS